MPIRTTTRQLTTILALVVLVAWAIVRATRPPAPVRATAPDTVFSAARAMRHVARVAAAPHPMGTVEHDRVRDYIVAQLRALGVAPEIQATTGIGTRYPVAGRVENIIARLPGSAPNGASVLVVAHYDGVGAGPAAADDGAGVAAMIETIRALRARRTPLVHDVVFLFSDGEEAGLLGAAAFAREHPLARKVAVLNFEARGTSGRSYMFETGSGNLDAVRVLRATRDVTAGSMFTTVYRALPNDTDLSELSMLGTPAMNFAFAGGVERYHTSRDDEAYLDAGSLQHHGDQMLPLAARLADGPLPRPKTGDAVFFDLPFIGLVVYPVWLALPLAIVALLLTLIVLRATWRGALVGGAVMVVGLALLGWLGLSVHLRGPALWSGIYAAALGLFAAGVSIELYRLAKRWRPDAHSGALVVWLALSLATSIIAPGVSYLFTWPLLFALAAACTRHPVAEWLGAAVTILVVVGVAYVAGAIMLGLAGVGAAAMILLIALATWLVAKTIEAALVPVRGAATLELVLPAALLALAGFMVVKPSAAHPLPSSLVYAENADSGDAWLVTTSPLTAWSRSILGAAKYAAPWVSQGEGFGGRLRGRRVSRAMLQAPVVSLIADSSTGDRRIVRLRVQAPRGATHVIMRASGAPILATTIDGRAVDTTRYRYRSAVWTMTYWNVPDSGAVVGLTLPAGAHVDFSVASHRPGLPEIAGTLIPPRPSDVVPAQEGDVSFVVRAARF